MKCQIKKITKRNFRIRKADNNNLGGTWLLIDIPEEVYEEIRNKLHGKPYTGIHGEIMNSDRGHTYPTEVIFDYLYCNGFEYMFDE